MNELNLLMAARLKGRASVDAAAVYAGISAEDAVSQIHQLTDDGFLAGDKQVRVTPEGRRRIEELLTAERATIDHGRLEQAYEDFDSHNTTFKTVVTAWQMKDPATVNDHTDAAYDADVIKRLAAVHENFRPLLLRIIEIAARLAPYTGRFDRAITAVQQGDHTYVARPIMDSYHTVWFELHEELIGLLGRTRAAEAASGRAV